MVFSPSFSCGRQDEAGTERGGDAGGDDAACGDHVELPRSVVVTGPRLRAGRFERRSDDRASTSVPTELSVCRDDMSARHTDHCEGGREIAVRRSRLRARARRPPACGCGSRRSPAARSPARNAVAVQNEWSAATTNTCRAASAGAQARVACALRVLLAVPNTVTSTARPSEPPTCCMTLTSPDAAPASAGLDAVERGRGERHEGQAVAEAEHQQRADQVEVAARCRQLGEPAACRASRT